MDNLIYEIKRLEKRVRSQDLRTNSAQVTKIHSYAFLRKKPVRMLQRHKQRLEQRHQQRSEQVRKVSEGRYPKRVRTKREVYQEDPSTLYSSDWMTVVSALAQMAKKSPEACVIALGLGDPEQNLRPGLLWVVSPNRAPKLVNKKAFESMFWTCKNRRETRYIMGLLALSSRRYPRTNHILSYIYDLRENEIEVFDPNGGIQFEKNNLYSEFMDKYFQLTHFNNKAEGYFMNKLGIRNVYMSTQWCPVGIQEIEEQQAEQAEQQKPRSLIEKQQDFGGYCAAWSIWWLNQRLRYPNIERSQLLVLLTQKFQEQKVDLKKYVQSFAQELSKTKVQLMRTALQIGGRTKYEIDYMMKNYCKAETKCTKASNLLYHASKESNLGSAQLQNIERYSQVSCYETQKFTNPILVEVTANLETAVRLFSNGRIALSRHRF